MASAGPLTGNFDEPKKSKAGLYAAITVVAAVVVGAFMMLGGGTSGLVISVAGPGGTAVEGVSVFIDGKKVCTDSTCKIEDLEPGLYVVKATAEGYSEMAGKAYEVAAGEQKAINIELVSGSGGTGVKVSSKASGLTLSIDGKKIGALPQEVTGLEPGDHKIEISGSPFLKAFEETVTVKEGEMLDFEPELELEKGQVNIKLDETSRDAKVVLVVNGKRRSLASTIRKAKSDTVKIDLPVDDKEYQLVATRAGYEDFEQDLSFTVENPIQTLELTLDEAGSEADDDDISPAPAPRPRPTGGGSAAPRTSSPAPAPAPAAPAPTPAASGSGTLNINSIPVSSVILDGRPLGTTPKFGITVSAGPHTVVFIHPQHGRKVQTVNVQGGKMATAAVRFP